MRAVLHAVPHHTSFVVLLLPTERQNVSWREDGNTAAIKKDYEETQQLPT